MDPGSTRVLLVAGVIAVAYLWLSAPTLWPQSKGSREHPTESPPEGQQRRTRQPLEVLYPKPIDSINEEPEVDIIAVHGLGSNGINWLQCSRMLPAKVPRSRIMVYNYDSRWHADAPKTRLQLCGEELVHSIHLFRRGASGPPIIFIGHSLGGNVIVHGLLHANEEDKYKHLLEATVGLVFLGTPFRGTKWQPFIDSIARLMQPAGSHRGIIKELGFDEPVLLDTLHRFCRLCNRLSMPVACFRELYETDYGRRFVMGGMAKGMVVEEASACIPSLERHALQTDHLKINKYHDPNDRSYSIVSATISEMYTKAKDLVRRRQHQYEDVLEARPEAKECLRDLFLTDPFEDRNALKRKKGSRASGTCEWILGTEELTIWLGSDQIARPESQPTYVLWLHGNPGTGKSTMAMFLTEELSKAFPETDRKTLAYFFCDSGFDKRKTATSVVRGLLLQLVRQHPQLLDYLLPKYNERGAELFNLFDALWTIFMDAAAHQDTGRKYCIIDALDECDRESRLYPEIERYLRLFLNKDLASLQESKQEIELFITERVAGLRNMNRYPESVEEQVTQLLKDKAGGTFLWVGLACTELEPIASKDAVQFLQSLPAELDRLYEKLLHTALKQDKQKEGTIKRILSLVVLSEACHLHRAKDETERIQFMREEIASCRLLVIVQDEKVIPLHQSVKDYLAGSSSGWFIDELEAHADFAYRCVDLLAEQSGGTQSCVGLLAYATRDWANHARMAQPKFEIHHSQAGFLQTESPCRERWLESLRSHGSSLNFYERIPQQFSILHIAARWGVSTLVDYASLSSNQRAAESLGPLINCMDASGATPLNIAGLWGHSDVVSVLLYLGAKVTIKVVKAAARNFRNCKEVIALLLD
ncbi:vegetative incompatibility protein HET-E-1 [Xylaria grammica]|nr:vegetative incompatibility protein HET-E-1 [Xylaria grammica]